MDKHIVLLKLKNEISTEEKLKQMVNFKNAIESLPTKIYIIRKIEVGLTINPAASCTNAL